MEGIKQNMVTILPEPIPYDITKKILEQMENDVCKVRINANFDVLATGFFCKIPFPDINHMLPVFITNNHVINHQALFQGNNTITLSINAFTDLKKIDLNDRIKYTNEEYDITIIEIKDEDRINHYLELDEYIINDIMSDKNLVSCFEDQTVYMINYGQGKLAVSYGILDKIYENNKNNFTHKCLGDDGSSGSPISNIKNKVIGIHEDTNHNHINIGGFLSNPIKEFIKSHFNIRSEINEIIDEDETHLKEFKDKYNLNIKDTKVNDLELKWKGLGNEGLKDLCTIKFKNLKRLNVLGNYISDINILEKI